MRTLLILLWCLCGMLAARSQTDYRQRTPQLLKRIDFLVEHKEETHDRVGTQIGQLKKQALHATGQHKGNLLREIIAMYMHFKTDSAAVYIRELSQLADTLHDERLMLHAVVAQAGVLTITGEYGTCQALLDSAARHTLTYADRDLHLSYLYTRRTLYGWMLPYSTMPKRREKLTQLVQEMRDSLLALQGMHGDNNVILADQELARGNPQKAINLLLPQAKKLGEDAPDAYICYPLASAYKALGQDDAACYYLALTAISDLQRGITEYVALQDLAYMLHQKGDVTRAYKYLLCAMEDATICKSSLRSGEVQNIFPIIDRAYKAYQAQRDRTEAWILYGAIALLLFVSAFAFTLWKQMRKLSALRHNQAVTNAQLKQANKDLQQANSALQRANAELQATYASLRLTDKMKEEYLARYLDRCRDYIDKLNDYRRNCLKLLKEHQTDALLKELKRDNIVKQEQESFYHDFDAAFLTLFPDFIEKFNALLVPEARIHPRAEQQLNTELRIFALIRLGVNETPRIAHFLNFSLATVYNYRSRLRGRTLNPDLNLEEVVSTL